MDERDLERAAAALDRATCLVITAGAGMGVDSGLPDFRGDEGFWNAYPPYRHLRLSFSDLANPRWFRTDPHFAWGFYGHRLELYRRTTPHDGFAILRRWSERIPTFVFTSNVDGAFQRAGFSEEQILECHGSIHWLQTLDGDDDELLDASRWSVDVEPESFRARDPLPTHPKTGEMLRPNILMFGDGGWNHSRSGAQSKAYMRFLRDADLSRLVVVECGAGTAIPTVRDQGEELIADADDDAMLIRINPQERHARLPAGFGVSLVANARAGLEAIEARLGQTRKTRV
jgi:NAD-dependent SIR2 family protein deacetylase